MSILLYHSEQCYHIWWHDENVKYRIPRCPVMHVRPPQSRLTSFSSKSTSVSWTILASDHIDLVQTRTQKIVETSLSEHVAEPAVGMCAVHFTATSRARTRVCLPAFNAAEPLSITNC